MSINTRLFTPRGMVRLRPLSDWEKPLSSVGAVKGGARIREKMGRYRQITGPSSRIGRIARSIEHKYGFHKNPFGKLIRR